MWTLEIQGSYFSHQHEFVNVSDDVISLCARGSEPHLGRCPVRAHGRTCWCLSVNEREMILLNQNCFPYTVISVIIVEFPFRGLPTDLSMGVKYVCSVHLSSVEIKTANQLRLV